jgi:hypothetical protein
MISLKELWDTANGSQERFQSDQILGFPETVRNYLEHAIAPDTPLASAVRLQMHGEIKLNRWYPFDAKQVIHMDRGMIWQAGTRVMGLPIRGHDRIIDGKAAMRWKFLGIIPFLSASGPDIDRSTAGRLAAEFIWLPSVFCQQKIPWHQENSLQARAQLEVQGQESKLQFKIDQSGRLINLLLQRWGNPEGHEFHYENFGAKVESERTFGGYTIPDRLRIGWYFGTDKFESEGEFFRVQIDHAAFK